MSSNPTPVLLCFEDEQDSALRIAQAAHLALVPIARHRFPDGEIKLRLPDTLPAHVVILRSLNDPNEKLIELLLLAQTARWGAPLQGSYRDLTLYETPAPT